MTVGIGDRLILRGSVEAHGWLSGGESYEVAASVTVVEVLGRSIRVRVDEVSGLPRHLRREAGELFEGWHKLDDITQPSRVRGMGFTVHIT